VNRVMASFARRALDMNDRIQVLSQRTLRKKIYTLLVQYAAKAGSNTFDLPLSREDMAVFLGCDRSALSRELARMKEDGIIDYYRNSFKVMI
ncbi:MAG: winged helix-turn-helix domain-containing protein, partial [Clostridia bacterium]|nr:winged helix-turn-helix domain-containing protein [Clostridia bacterium]